MIQENRISDKYLWQNNCYKRKSNSMLYKENIISENMESSLPEKLL